MLRAKDGAYHQVASYGQFPEHDTFMFAHPLPAGRGSVVGRTALEGRNVHVPDVLTDPEFQLAHAAKLGGGRTMLGIPLLREGVPIGVRELVTGNLRQIWARLAPGLRRLLTEALGQKRVLGRGLPSWAHVSLFAGFMMLFLGTTMLEIFALVSTIVSAIVRPLSLTLSALLRPPPASMLRVPFSPAKTPRGGSI